MKFLAFKGQRHRGLATNFPINTEEGLLSHVPPRLHTAPCNGHRASQGCGASPASGGDVSSDPNGGKAQPRGAQPRTVSGGHRLLLLALFPPSLASASSFPLFLFSAHATTLVAPSGSLLMYRQEKK